MRVSTDSTVRWLLEKVAIQFLHGYYRPKGTVKSKGGDRPGEGRCRLLTAFELISS